jgi:hypothetical protein
MNWTECHGYGDGNQFDEAGRVRGAEYEAPLYNQLDEEIISIELQARSSRDSSVSTAIHGLRTCRNLQGGLEGPGF